MGQGDFMIVKRTLVTVILLGSILALITGCSIISPPTATFEITEWTQQYVFGIYATYVYVYFTVTNTGPVHIDRYYVWIDVTCVDGNTYEERASGSNIPLGSYRTAYKRIHVSGNEAVSVSIRKYELKSY